MKKAFIIIVGVLAFMLLTVAPVYAAKAQQVSGTWGPTPGGGIIGPEKTAGGNHFDVFTNFGVYKSGPIEGTFEQTVEVAYHTGLPDFDPDVTPWPPANFTWKIERIIDATVDGKSGTLVMHLNAKGSTPPAPGTLQGTWVIISGTDELSGLRGQGTWWNIGGQTLGYEGKIHFSP